MGYNWYNLLIQLIITLYYIPIYDYYMTRMIFWVCIPTSEPLMFIPPWYSQYVSTISPFYPHHQSRREEHRPFFSEVVARLRELRDIQVEAMGEVDHGHGHGYGYGIIDIN